MAVGMVVNLGALSINIDYPDSLAAASTEGDGEMLPVCSGISTLAVQLKQLRINPREDTQSSDSFTA